MNKIRALVFDGALTARLAFAALWLSLFAYAGRPLLVAARAGGIAPAIAWLALFGCSLLPLLPVLVRRTDALRKRSIMHWTGYATLAIFSMLLVLVALSDVVRLAFFIARAAVPSQTISFSVLVAAAALSIVGLLQARCPRIRHVKVEIDDLRPELDGYRIAQWSDVHVGPTIQRPFVEALVERTNALGVDAIAITGDLVDGYVDELRDQVQPLADLRARDGVFYVTGNHEYYWRASEWLPELQRLGLIFLKNEHHVVRPGLVIAGVTDPVGRDAHKQDLGAALEDAPHDAVKILLSHRPQTAQAARNLGVDVQ